MLTKIYCEPAFKKSMAKTGRQKLISVVVQNVEERRPFDALATCGHDGGTNCE